MRKILEDCIFDLSLLLEEVDINESECQQWFENYPAVFEVLGYVKSISHPRFMLNDSNPMIPDFIVQRADKLWEIFELKRPNTLLLKSPERRTTFYSCMQEYIAQCEEYSESCSDYKTIQCLREAYGIDVNRKPECVLVAGRSLNLNRHKIHDILSRRTVRIKHYTFDDLFDRLQDYYNNNFSGGNQRIGMIVYTCLYLPSKDDLIEECLFDFGCDLDKNRIVLLRIGHARLRFLAINDRGLYFSQDIDVGKYWSNGRFLIGIHIQRGADDTEILLEINGEYVVEHKISRELFITQHPIPFSVGVDMAGRSPACLYFGEHCVVDSTISIVERSTIREYLLQKWGIQSASIESNKMTCVKFGDGSHLYSEGHPRLDPAMPASTNLVQRNDELRPTLSYMPSI